MNALTSKTTQNVGATAGPVAGMLTWLVTMAFDKWELPGGVEGRAAVIGALCLVVIPLVSRLVAFLRTPEKSNMNTVRTTTKLPLWLMAGAVGVLACLQGCATSMPSVRGRTHYEVSFYDVVPPTAAVQETVFEDGTVSPAVAATPGQDTRFDIKIIAPAGVNISEIANMAYIFEESVSVNSESIVSTQGQADMIPVATAVDADIIATIAATVAQVAIEAALPGYLASTAAGVRQSEIRASSRANMLRAVQELIGGWQTGTTAPAP